VPWQKYLSPADGTTAVTSVKLQTSDATSGWPRCWSKRPPGCIKNHRLLKIDDWPILTNAWVKPSILQTWSKWNSKLFVTVWPSIIYMKIHRLASYIHKFYKQKPKFA
jgi:hypothetical protein